MDFENYDHLMLCYGYRGKEMVFKIIVSDIFHTHNLKQLDRFWWYLTSW